MSQTCKLVTLGLSFLIVAVYCGVEIVPERAKVVYMNKKYFYNLSLTVKRYSRNGRFYFNVDLTTKQTWTNNVTMNIVFNEYVHNEYRRSFIELRHKFCDMVNYDTVIGPVFKLFGVYCPYPPGHLRVTNFSFPLDNFPNIFPFAKCRVDTAMTISSTNESMALVSEYVTFKGATPK